MQQPIQSQAAASLQQIVDAIKAKHRAKQAVAAAQRKPIAAEALADKRARLQAALAEAQQGFDPAYPQCDDYTEWTRQAAKAANIAFCTRELAELCEVAA